MEGFSFFEHEVDQFISYSSPDQWEVSFMKAKGEDEEKDTDLLSLAFTSMPTATSSSFSEEQELVLLEKRHRKPGVIKTPKASRGTKNIPKNYANRIASFAISELALPYLTEKYGKLVSITDFQEYISDKKAGLTSINNFRELLQATESDEDIEKIYKEMFQYISIVFIKYFSVNWIFNSKLSYKEEHLKYRFKILRRVQNPELFTYLKKW